MGDIFARNVFVYRRRKVCAKFYFDSWNIFRSTLQFHCILILFPTNNKPITFNELEGKFENFPLNF